MLVVSGGSVNLEEGFEWMITDEVGMSLKRLGVGIIDGWGTAQRRYVSRLSTHVYENFVDRRSPKVSCKWDHAGCYQDAGHVRGVDNYPLGKQFTERP
jgi:hypothetical protein